MRSMNLVDIQWPIIISSDKNEKGVFDDKEGAGTGNGIQENDERLLGIAVDPDGE